MYQLFVLSFRHRCRFHPSGRHSHRGISLASCLVLFTSWNVNNGSRQTTAHASAQGFSAKVEAEHTSAIAVMLSRFGDPEHPHLFGMRSSYRRRSRPDRRSGGEGKSVSVGGELGGGRSIKK